MAFAAKPSALTVASSSNEQQPASRNRARQGAGDAGGTKAADHLPIHDRPTNGRTDLIAAHSAQNEIAAAGFLLLCQRQKRGENHDAQVTHRARVHVFAHQSMAERCIRECRFGWRRSHRLFRSRLLCQKRRRHADRLAAPRQIARFKGARQHVQQPDLDLRDHLWRKLIYRQIH